jgi:hypothetical protein
MVDRLLQLHGSYCQKPQDADRQFVQLQGTVISKLLGSSVGSCRSRRQKHDLEIPILDEDHHERQASHLLVGRYHR